MTFYIRPKCRKSKLRSKSNNKAETMTERYYKFVFFDGQIFYGWGLNERDALKGLGLEAYNPVAYTVTDVTPNVTGAQL